ncbi:MAG: hypothetical protein Q8R28_10930, partial [Dehalococcoidia bacterium]|nr:hypothetical protein [Dehalococcoidia bacterium]
MPALALSRSGSTVHTLPYRPHIQLPLFEQAANPFHRTTSPAHITTNSIPHELCGFHLGISLAISPALIEHSRSARPYALVALLMGLN